LVEISLNYFSVFVYYAQKTGVLTHFHPFLGSFSAFSFCHPSKKSGDFFKNGDFFQKKRRSGVFFVKTVTFY